METSLIEGVAVSSVVSLQTPGVFRAKLDATQTDRLAADSDASLSEQVFNVTMAEIESVVKPDALEITSGGNRWRLYVSIAGLYQV